MATGIVALACPSLAQAEPVDPSQSARFEKTEPTSVLQTSGKPRSVDADGKVRVMVQLTGDPVAVVQAHKGRKLTRKERSAVKQDLQVEQAALAQTITGRGGTIESKLQSAYNGMRVTLSSEQVDSVAALPGVAGVRAVSIQTIDNKTSVPYLGVPQVWQNTGYTGKGVKIAVIDTGIDYTHATFGGRGTPAAFAAAKNAVDPAQFGTAAPRVKGGYDFVGDDYDADAAVGSPQLVAQPDDNPLDCNGHGSHVAGTAAGGGVMPDGTAYRGPYPATTTTSFKVGPGVAPQADLYALRVFGCDGSTDVTTEAIDWAVEHDMDVINLSLGSDFGTKDDPVSVAASNAVGAGIVVVASAGNAGQSPYVVGSPAAADGVIAVAAVDSSKALAGVTLTLPGTTLAASNSNGATLPSKPLTLVELSDQADTSEDESLGCSTGAYTAAGIAPGQNQLAVVTRGECARVAKPIYGQQAGAAGVVMVNTEPGYPPSEGEITSNPDDNDAPYPVTIPFLGVRSADADALTAADGKSVSLTATSLQNPDYQRYASFTSSGPRTGDSAISPNVAAPGVSIASARVGTGSGAEVMSGTSMAAPHVAGVAALTVQAHPGWSSQDLSAAITSTADPERVTGQQLTHGGLGLVDAAQAVGTQVTVTGDSFATTSGRLREAALSFGFAEPDVAFSGSRTLTITNHGIRSVTYQLAVRASDQSRPASVSLSTRSVTVRPGRQAQVRVTLTASASRIGSSIAADDPSAFLEVSGSVVLTAPSGVLRVPYLLVPRAPSKVDLTTVGSSRLTFFVDRAGQPGGPGSVTLKLSNRRGALAGAADFYTWGLADARDVMGATGGGYDLRAVGVQSFPTSDTDQQLVFAVNNYTRWSNAASREFDIGIDRTGDGEADLIVFSADSGYTRTGTADGVSEVFVFDPASGEVTGAGYRAQAPTDSSTMLLPVDASTLGLTAAAGTFSYTVTSYDVTGAGGDEMPGTATYNPWAKAVTDGDYFTVTQNRVETVKVGFDRARYSQQKPLGLMVVALDNQSGAQEAILVSGR